MVFAKKKWGQNFLVDNNLLEKIIKTIDIKKDDEILEIGGYPNTSQVGQTSRILMQFSDTDINNVMYAYIDRKKKLPVTTLFRAIGYQGDKEILEIFDLAEEIKVTKPTETKKAKTAVKKKKKVTSKKSK